MEWCQKFLRAGEAFIRDKSDLLRSIIAIQCGKFFQSYHGTNTDALETMLSSEQFVNVSLPTSAIQNNGGSFGTMLSSTLDRDIYESLSREAGFDASDFDAWIDRGNPFRASSHNQDKRSRRHIAESDLVLNFGGASNMDDDLASQQLEVNVMGQANRNGLWTSDSYSTTRTLSRRNTETNNEEEEEEEEEDPELFGHDIDEETQTVRMDETNKLIHPESTGTTVPSVVGAMDVM